MSDSRRAESPFPNTAWSLVARAAGDVRSSVRRRTLEALLRQYGPALRAYLMARRRLGPHEADDLLQGFLASKVLEQQILRRADPARGKFRTFLMTALERYAVSEYRRDSAAKRSPGRAPAPLTEVAEAEHPASRESADLFDIAWAKQAVEVAVGRMRRECEAGGRVDLWGVFKARVLDPALHGAAPAPYDQLVPALGLESPAKAANLLATAKRMFARSLREVVAEYAEDEADAEEEVRRLRAVLAGGNGNGNGGAR